MKRNGCPSIKTVTAVIHDIWKDMRRGDKTDYRGEFGDYSLDVRLRVHDGSWQVLTGSPDYDTDHRGHWGASCIPWARCSHGDIARDLVDQVLDSIAESVNC